ncbi:hypothetical protein PO909_013506 [Leuciscus waleckii]
MCASIIAKLQGNGVANSVIMSVVESMEDFVTDFHTSLRENILDVVPVDSTSRSSVEDVFNSFHNPFSDFNTDTKWRKYFSEKWGVVEPTEIHLGVRYDTRKNKISGMYEQIPVNDTFIYIPLLKTLEFIFRNNEYSPSNLIQEKRQSDTYRDLCDGQYYKNHPLYSIHSNALQIQIYYDDFETANPLGSQHGIHKLGCLYFVLRNLPAHINSSLMNIHLIISLFHSEDGKKYGMDKILGPLVDDVKILEQEGMKVSFSEEPIFGTIAQFTSDNLGLNGILGYVESFSAKHYCRLCLTDKVLAQEVFSEDDPRVILRSRNLNEEHKYLADKPYENSCYGIKRNSVLNTLTYFNVSENFVLDIMHDILEGVAQYEVKLLFEYMSCNLISCDSIPQRLYAFNYGYLDKNKSPNQPSTSWKQHWTQRKSDIVSH